MSDVRTERRTKNKPTTLNEGVRESSDEQTIKEMPGEGQDERLGGEGLQQPKCLLYECTERGPREPTVAARKASKE
jgi:hypothetical protein